MRSHSVFIVFASLVCAYKIILELSAEMFKIDDLRKHHENPTEWRIRRAFLEKNVGLLPPDRLECLSHCFVNVELYGNGYPEKVMSQVTLCSSLTTFLQVKEYGEGILTTMFPDT